MINGDEGAALDYVRDGYPISGRAVPPIEILKHPYGYLPGPCGVRTVEDVNQHGWADSAQNEFPSTTNAPRTQTSSKRLWWYNTNDVDDDCEEDSDAFDDVVDVDRDDDCMWVTMMTMITMLNMNIKMVCPAVWLSRCLAVLVDECLCVCVSVSRRRHDDDDDEEDDDDDDDDDDRDL